MLSYYWAGYWISIASTLDFRYAYTPEQVRNKPGREVVTFLLVCNLAMWAINTLETNRADSHPIQVRRSITISVSGKLSRFFLNSIN